MSETEEKRGPGRPRKSVPNVAPHKIIEPMEMEIGQDGVVHDVGEGEAENIKLVKPVAESIEDPIMAEKLAYERFMNEKIRIHIHEVSDKHADPRFDVSVNGRSRIFSRGEAYDVERYYVEVLARAKPVTYDNEEYTKPDGTHGVRWPTRTGLRYPFSVIYDPNPRGPDWLTHVLKQG